MSTNDVPGAKAANNDELAMGCWAEHEDGSLIFVEGTEGDKIVYSIFDVSQDPPVEYRDAMPEDGFKKHFSWDSKNPQSEKWTWHDKTPFDWERIIGKGVGSGQKYPSAHHQLTAAQRVAKHIGVEGQEVEPEKVRHLTEKLSAAAGAMVEGLQKAIGELKT